MIQTVELLDNGVTPQIGDKTPEQWLAQAEALDIIRRMLSSLTPRQEHVLRLHYGLAGERELTYAEIGAQFGLSGSRIMQIAARAIERLRQPSSRAQLREAAELLELDTVMLPTRRWRPSWGPARAPAPPPPPPPRRPPLTPVAELPEASLSLVQLLRIPPEARLEPVKRVIAWHLEQTFMQRGAGDLVIHSYDEHGRPRTRLQIELRKYDYLMANMHWLWQQFPPAPVLEEGCEP